jgi:hypothetical protein
MSYASPGDTKRSVDGNHEQEHLPTATTRTTRAGITFGVAVSTARHRLGDHSSCSKAAEHEREGKRKGKGEPWA